MDPLIQELRQFIVDNFLFGDESERFAFSETDSFQERGIVDSTGILELVCHLEEKYAIEPGDRVAICLENSIDAVVAIFGVLKAGAVFFVVNPHTRPERLASLLTDSAASAVISKKGREKGSGIPFFSRMSQKKGSRTP